MRSSTSLLYLATESVLSQQLLTRRSPFQTERSHFRSVKGRQDGKTVGADERHPPVARVDMAMVGTSMSDGQCHEVGHQAEAIAAIAAIAEMAAEGTKRVVVPISRMNGAIVITETLSIVDGVMMEDKVKATGIHVSATIDARNATCASSVVAMRAIRGWTTLRLVEGITSQGIGMKIDVEMSDNVLTVESSRIGVLLLLEMCTTGARRHQSAKAEEEMISTQVNGRKFQWAGTR